LRGRRGDSAVCDAFTPWRCHSIPYSLRTPCAALFSFTVAPGCCPPVSWAFAGANLPLLIDLTITACKVSVLTWRLCGLAERRLLWFLFVCAQSILPFLWRIRHFAHGTRTYCLRCKAAWFCRRLDVLTAGRGRRNALATFHRSPLSPAIYNRRHGARRCRLFNVC
jgi:hypothetical protein